MTKGGTRHIFENEADDERSECYMQAEDMDFKADEGSQLQYKKMLTVNRKTKCLRLNPSSKCMMKRSQIGGNAARERTRVHQLKQAFTKLQNALPNVPEGTKLSKLDILLLATNHISHLMSKLSQGYVEEHLKRMNGKEVLHPIKKWPMRTRLYVTDHHWSEESHDQTQEWNAVTNTHPRSVSNRNRSSLICSAGYDTFGDENMLPGSGRFESEDEWRLADISEDRVAKIPMNYSSCRKVYIPERN